MTLPSTVTVSALIPGHFYLPHKEVFQDALENKATTGDTVPTFAFLIEHPSHGKYLFDLGLRKHGKGYPPAWDETLEEFKPDCSEDVCDILRASHVEPTEVKGVIFSHLHFDHTGDVEPFTSAEIILGAEAKSLFDKPYPGDPESLFPAWPENRTVRYLEFSGPSDSSENDAEDTNEDSTSCPLPAFQKVLDFFSDQSFFIIDAPGHFPGHLMALARVSTDNSDVTNTSASKSNPDTSTYILLAADCCHNRQCYTPGTRLISQENYDDIAVARETVSSLVRTAKDMSNVIVVLAHEKELEEEGMPLLPNSLNEWAVGRVKERMEKKSESADVTKEVVEEKAKATKKRSREEPDHEESVANGKEEQEKVNGESKTKKAKVSDEKTSQKRPRDEEGDGDENGAVNGEEEEGESRKKKAKVLSE